MAAVAVAATITTIPAVDNRNLEGGGMPIHDIECRDCGHQGETLSLKSGDALRCPACGGRNVVKRMSATSTLTGKSAQPLPGPGDTGCCGSSPGHANCAGPGSCCGKNRPG